jgi:hypothetical protein
MIENKHQYEVTKSKIRDLKKGLAQLLVDRNKMQVRIFTATQCGFQATIAQMEAEIGEYEALRRN